VYGCDDIIGEIVSVCCMVELVPPAVDLLGGRPAGAGWHSDPPRIVLYFYATFTDNSDAYGLLF